MNSALKGAQVLTRQRVVSRASNGRSRHRCSREVRARPSGRTCWEAQGDETGQGRSWDILNTRLRDAYLLCGIVES